MGTQSNYEKIIEWLFLRGYSEGVTEVHVERDDILLAIKKLKLERPKNLGDVIYSYRYRKSLPKKIAETAPEGARWIIRGKGDGRYCFSLTRQPPIVANAAMVKIKIPDATPGVIAKYAFSDEQALLARLRYNRLIDIFTGVVCYSLQSHLRTKIPGIGQVETDELYVGVDQSGVQYVLHVQAKGHRDKIEIVQIEQDFALAQERFADLICRPIGAQFLENDVIALFEFVIDEENVSVRREQH